MSLRRSILSTAPQRAAKVILVVGTMSEAASSMATDSRCRRCTPPDGQSVTSASFDKTNIALKSDNESADLWMH
ncbi:hypothetical protein FDENT_11383 [Fusarium denticulatum]|uniref:Uncharacterized protein n=1 Tax=Fusarium denticulatum TaxID=48507 RepID=A0A8H5WNW4_9HYPO|nr:hypothetical protein FDENT_11383 [Fusarium denticulatum]